PARTRAMRMDGDGDLVLLTQLVEAVERVHRRVGADALDADGFRPVEDLLVGVVILGEAFHAVGDGRDAVFLAQLQGGLELIPGQGARQLVATVEELAVADAAVLHALERLFEVELAERIALDADREAAETIVFLVVGSDGSQTGNGDGTGFEKVAAGKAFGM